MDDQETIRSSTISYSTVIEGSNKPLSASSLGLCCTISRRAAAENFQHLQDLSIVLEDVDLVESSNFESVLGSSPSAPLTQLCSPEQVTLRAFSNALYFFMLEY